TSFIWPIFAVSPALVLIGLTAQIALIHIDTIMKERMPKETAGSIVGAARTLTNLSYAASFMIWGWLFQLFLAKTFVLLAIYCTGIAAVYLWISRILGRLKN